MQTTPDPDPFWHAMRLDDTGSFFELASTPWPTGTESVPQNPFLGTSPPRDPPTERRSDLQEGAASHMASAILAAGDSSCVELGFLWSILQFEVELYQSVGTDMVLAENRIVKDRMGL